MLPMNSRWTGNLGLRFALILAFLPVATASAHIPIPPKKGEIGRRSVATVVADFSLVNQDGQPFRFADSQGKLVLVTFIFATCPDVCSLLSAKFASIQRVLQEKKRDDYLLLSISTDPERDTPTALKAYAENYKADLRHWVFLTGSPKQLEKVWTGFGVNVQKSAGGEVRHTALTTLIDRRGVRRVDYYGDKWQEQEILRDISWLTTQKLQ